jgi:hypothetical protein
MKVRIQYQFEGRLVDFITSPPAATTPDFEDYKAEILRWFPNATVEVVPEAKESEIVEIVPEVKESEIVEFEL